MATEILIFLMVADGLIYCEVRSCPEVIIAWTGRNLLVIYPRRTGKLSFHLIFCFLLYNSEASKKNLCSRFTQSDGCEVFKNSFGKLYLLL